MRAVISRQEPCHVEPGRRKRKDSRSLNRVYVRRFGRVENEKLKVLRAFTREEQLRACPDIRNDQDAIGKILRNGGRQSGTPNQD